MDNVPKETETIAHKKAVRISEKIKLAGSRINLKNSWWTDPAIELISIAIIFAANLYLILPLVGTPAVATRFSGPVIPLLAGLISLTGVGFSYSTQLVGDLFFLIFPFTFYFFVKFVSGRKFAAFLSALIATLPFYAFAGGRIEFGLLSNESPFIASIGIMPVALIWLLKFLRTGGIKNLIIVSLINAFTALTSPFGIFIYAIIAMVTTFSEMLLGEGRIKILRLVTVFLFSASLCSFWYNPGLFYWMVTGPLGTEIRIMVGHIIPISLFTVPILASIGYLLFDRKPNLQPFFLALFYTITFLIVVASGGGILPSNPGRYIPVLGVSMAFLIGIGILMVFENLHFLNIKAGNINSIKNFLLLFLSLFLIIYIFAKRESVVKPPENYLTGWNDVQKGDIWVVRDKFNIANSLPGYFISFVAAGSLTYLYRKK